MSERKMDAAWRANLAAALKQMEDLPEMTPEQAARIADVVDAAKPSLRLEHTINLMDYDYPENHAPVPCPWDLEFKPDWLSRMVPIVHGGPAKFELNMEPLDEENK